MGKLVHGLGNLGVRAGDKFDKKIKHSMEFLPFPSMFVCQSFFLISHGGLCVESCWGRIPASSSVPCRGAGRVTWAGAAVEPQPLTACLPTVAVTSTKGSGICPPLRSDHSEMCWGWRRGWEASVRGGKCRHVQGGSLAGSATVCHCEQSILSVML